MKIISARITAMPRSMPKGMFHQCPKIWATFADGSERCLFSFFPDEPSFQPSEFIGLSEAEVIKLKRRKDLEWLGCPPHNG